MYPSIGATKVASAKLAQLENILYGTAGVDGRLPLPSEVVTIVGTTLVAVEATAPTYSSATKQITFPVITGVDYYADGVKRTAPYTITKDTVVTAQPQSGYTFTATSDDDWTIKYS